MIAGKQIIDMSLIAGNINNNVMIQFFEENTSLNVLKKLDTIDAGSFVIDGINKNIIFVGKVIIDSFEQPTFVNLFTAEIEAQSV
jgi:hypothetical protein